MKNLLATSLLLSTIALCTFNATAMDLQTVEALSQEIPLHTAALENNSGEVKLLLASGIPADIADSKGRTALDIADTHGYEEVACILLQAMSPQAILTHLKKQYKDFNTTLINNKTAMHIAAVIVATLPEKKELIELVAKEQNDINAKEARSGWTALHVAVAFNAHSLVEQLLAHGAKSTIADEAGETPAGLALRLDRIEIGSLLLDAIPAN